MQVNNNLCPHKNLFMSAHKTLFIIPKQHKQLICPSADEWINKTWHIHTVEYYLDMKKNKVLIPAIIACMTYG